MRLIDADKLCFEGQHYNKSQLKAILDFIDEQPTAYDVDKVVEKIKNINTTWNCQECILIETCDKIQMEKGSGGEHIDLCAEVVKVLSIEIVKADGVNE